MDEWPIGVVVIGAWPIVVAVPITVVAVPIMVVDVMLFAPLPPMVFICPRSITSPVLGCCAATWAWVYIASLAFASRTIV